ncbi:MAG: hypothetical protein CL843_14880 [Crocinitomicaceae bacterium]|nr:hypothetical protein [Crocinitomicaceae bacterium]|tara:strand:- start:3374 stop:4336 length:963 start_codon:yes stop_codon:yes gene_type:complete
MIQYKLLFLFFWCTFFTVQGQNFEYVAIDQPDSLNLYINDEESTDLYYWKLVPSTPVKGVIVILPSGGERAEMVIPQVQLPQLAAEQGILTVVPSINWGTEDRHAEIALINGILDTLEQHYHFPKENVVLGGLSNGGVVALTYAEQAAQHPTLTYTIPKGVFGLDVPLDKAHLYAYCEREIARGTSEVGMNEARWIKNNYQQTYGGSPQEFPERYVNASIYSYGVKHGGNAQYLKQMPIRMYTDLDVNWLLNQRGRDLYDWNGTDIVAMINDLRHMGNTDANVIISMGKGIRPDGSRHPHSWSILDNEDCLNWILTLFEK